MATKQLNGRIVMKHDTAANWEKATSFIPKIGEIIIYDTDDENSFPRVKIGDGITTAPSLPFIFEPLTKDAIDEVCNQQLYAATEIKF